ncbi:hypothetical protein BU15DRAFT_78500 [Melanogaster broomeanus]|nr:hypothetical protein BU15DRAFT_78500 [Melanogaster broomeanus]
MKSTTIVLALSRKERPPRPEYRLICYRDWDFVQQCWSSADVRPSIDKIVAYTSSVIASRDEHNSNSLVVTGSLQSSYNPANLNHPEEPQDGNRPPNRRRLV